METSEPLISVFLWNQAVIVTWVLFVLGRAKHLLTYLKRKSEIWKFCSSNAGWIYLQSHMLDAAELGFEGLTGIVRLECKTTKPGWDHPHKTTCTHFSSQFSFNRAVTHSHLGHACLRIWVRAWLETNLRPCTHAVMRVTRAAAGGRGGIQ